MITGTATNVCCESTARDAMMLDYEVIMVSDGTAALTDEEHAAALNTFMLFFGDVMSTDETIARLVGLNRREV
jgi:ureidoacrylate peracid hydrolase